jgi:hypothetical protein
LPQKRALRLHEVMSKTAVGNSVSFAAHQTLSALFDALPERAKRQAQADYQLFSQNPRHPSL